MSRPTITATPFRTDGLAGALASWLPGARWFAGKGREPRRIEIVRAASFADDLDRGGPRGMLAIVNVHYADGADQYLVPLGFRRELPAELAPARIGPLPGARLVVYDATADEELNLALLRLIATDQERHDVRYGIEPRGEHALVVRRRMPSRPVGVEQSNTSIVFGERYILKLFRRLISGENPDVELHRALNRTGNPHIAPLLGAIETEHAGAPVTLGALHSFAADAVDGWRIALDDVAAELTGTAPDRAYTKDWHRLGGAVAAVHADLATVLGSRRMSAVDLQRLRDVLHGRLAAAVRVQPALAPLRDKVRAVYDAVTGERPGLPVHRVHGDLHLGQVLRTPARWLLLDFEGEPSAEPAERLAPHPPLRDVAGILRSFDYAAAYQLHTGQHSDPVEARRRAARWTARVRGEFLRGYATAAGADPRAWPRLLTAYELDKAIYEVGYETRNRPEWTQVPLRAVRALAGADGADLREER
jgi:maltokinase